LSKKKGIKTNIIFEEDKSEFFQDIFGDKNRFEQIFINFISNALKFTPQDGSVEVVIKCLKLTEALNSQEKAKPLVLHNRVDDIQEESRSL